jgi:hypothetical protein
MSPEDVVGLAIAAVVVLVPVLAVSARVALRPIVDSLVRLNQAFGSASSTESKQRIAELENRVEQLTEQVRRLEEAEAFHRQLSRGEEPRQLREGAKVGTST